MSLGHEYGERLSSTAVPVIKKSSDNLGFESSLEPIWQRNKNRKKEEKSISGLLSNLLSMKLSKENDTSDINGIFPT